MLVSDRRRKDAILQDLPDELGAQGAKNGCPRVRALCQVAKDVEEHAAQFVVSAKGKRLLQLIGNEQQCTVTVVAQYIEYTENIGGVVVEPTQPSVDEDLVPRAVGQRGHRLDEAFQRI